MACEENNRLLLAYNTAAKLYWWTVENFKRNHMTADEAASGDFKRDSEYARQNCEAARTKLKQHSLTHGCECPVRP